MAPPTAAHGDGEDVAGPEATIPGVGASDASIRPATGTHPVRRRRRDGIVVPLRVPLRARLRAATGLVFMVILLGTVFAAIVVVLALAGAQALSNF